MLGPDARSLLDEASGGDEPSAADEARVRQRLAVKLAGVAGVTGATAATTTAKASILASLGGAKLLVVVSAVALATAGTVAVAKHSKSRPQAVASRAPIVTPTANSVAATAPSSARVASETPDPSAAPAPARLLPNQDRPGTELPNALPLPNVGVAQRGVASSADTNRVATYTSPSPSPSTSTSSSTSDPLLAEAMLLRRANDLLAVDPRAALGVLDEHAMRFPRGALSSERDATRVFALCSANRTDDALREADRFLSSNPRSPLASRVRQTCRTKP